MAATYLSRVRIYSRVVVLGQAGIAVLVVALFRRGIRAIHHELVKARFDLKRVLLIGTREEALALTERLTGAAELGIDVVGYVDDGGDALGTRRELPETVERFKIQEVLICESHQHDRALLPFLVHSRRRMIQTRVISPLASFLGTGVRVEEFAGLTVFSMERSSLFRFERALKRSVDCLAGIAGLPFVSFGSLIARVYGTIGGRMQFFAEERIGKGGKRLSWPRAIGSSGREAGDFLKPQLCLFLIGGSLSLVGPPALNGAQSDALAGTLRSVRPGITGRWRLSRRGAAIQALEEEALGLESWSMGRDVSIFIATIDLMCSGTYPAWFYGTSKGDAV